MRSTPSRTPILAAAIIALAVASPAAGQESAPQGPTGGAEATLDEAGLTVSPGALLNRTLTIRGRVAPGDAGRTVQVARKLVDDTWQEIGTAIIDENGAFRATWKTDQLGRVVLRATVDRGDAATASSTPLTAQTTVFQGAIASWYGPGFFGRRTACGTKLTRRTIGVAHRTLPCGTKVQLYHRGKTITAPVIDRGPFVRGRHWDLTHATAKALRVRHTVRVGVLPPPEVLRARKAR